ncbi:DedA family protein [Streptacidiphilus jiangxiensis]|uniref:Membrane protein DedA, SNARE-associated domain n=1 Tax=Streptacidiphilus jiangxiensis TaxID=235985 RepID=A0A1H7V673_STRJI|nr:VTT domain-containing protein [Streptacidiphilus jiangxiensis]SEM04604.1 membrane protein DedA, SNARE-associated domain [Streptacidiphilus jiangxiensis]
MTTYAVPNHWHAERGQGMTAGVTTMLLALDPDAPESIGYVALFLLVAFGAVIPIVPTAALVAATAVAAFHSSTAPLDVPIVVVAGALGAWCGDVALYSLAGRAENRWAGRIQEKLEQSRHGHRAGKARARLEAHGPGALVIARLIPGGRVPTFAACLLSGWSVRRFAPADIPATLVWSTVFVAVGVLGGALFAKPWQGILAAVLLVLVAGAAPLLWRRRRGHHHDAEQERA